MRYYFVPIRKTKLKLKTVLEPNAGEDVEKLDYTYPAGGNKK